VKTMDHRIAERRQHVSEDKARGRLRVLIWIVVVVLVVGLGIWLVNSPLLSIRDVTVTGADRSNPEEIAASVGIEPGVPTIGVRTGNIEDALSSDPWIADAKVVVSWPGAIEIDVASLRLPTTLRSSTMRASACRSPSKLTGP